MSPDAQSSSAAPRRGFHLLAKPVGPSCNLRCRYCFYCEKEVYFPEPGRRCMSDDLLERFVRSYIEANDGPEIAFAWQGGEPAMAGLDFYRRAVALQKRYANGKRISNSLQTNATLLDDAWCAFLTEERFLVGVSLDGPAAIHDRYRVSRGGEPSHARVMEAVARLKRFGTEFNTLTCVTRESARTPLEVYRFLREAGSRFHQFIPLVEREPDARARAAGLEMAFPPRLDQPEENTRVLPWTPDARDYGRFLCAIFDEWIRHDVGRIFVNHFEMALAGTMGLEPPLCVYQRECGNALVIEHDGGIYACDHFVYPDYYRGNIGTQDLRTMVETPAQIAFGRDKRDRLPRYCRQCPYLRLCNGECPKHRFLRSPEGEPGLNYLCAGLRKFYQHAAPGLARLGQLLRAGEPPARVMEQIAQDEAGQAAPGAETPRNAPCPCGSGRKFKQCCGRTA